MAASPHESSKAGEISLLDQEYDSEEDSDFDPTSAPTGGDDDALSSSDGDSDVEGSPKEKPTKKRKRTFSIDDFGGGEGGLIKTRSQRAAESREKLGGVKTGTATTDVDRLWAEMNKEPVKKASSEPEKDVPSSGAPESDTTALGENNNGVTEARTKTAEMAKEVLSETGEKMVSIKTTYEFAGKTITEEKLVPVSSETARIYLSSKASDSPSPAPSNDPSRPARRQPPKKRASAFDAAAAARAKPNAPTKLNTLEKSRLDWAGFVDKEGIGDDLKKWNKGDKGYLDRQAFLGRVDENRDRQWKEANKKI